MKEKIAGIKEHIRENKAAYIGTGVGILVGAAGVTLLRPQSNAQITQQIRQVAWRANANQVVIHLAENSTPSKPVHLVGTDLYFSSLSDAARKTGHDLAALSRHVNGHSASVKGDIFEVLKPA